MWCGLVDACSNPRVVESAGGATAVAPKVPRPGDNDLDPTWECWGLSRCQQKQAEIKETLETPRRKDATPVANSSQSDEVVPLRVSPRKAVAEKGATWTESSPKAVVISEAVTKQASGTSKRKGAAALLNGLRTGEVAKIVDTMENQVPEANPDWTESVVPEVKIDQEATPRLLQTEPSRVETQQPPAGCCRALIYRIQQQEPASNKIPYKWYCRHVQAYFAGFCAVMLGVFGACAFFSATSITQVAVSYKYPDLHADFSVEEAMVGDVNMWYELEVVGINQKRYIENADSALIQPFLMGKKTCTDSEDKSDVAWRRNENFFRSAAGNAEGLQEVAPDKFTQLVERVPGNSFRPCGLQALAMFTDEYALDLNIHSTWLRLPLHESDIVLDADHEIYEGKIKPFSDDVSSGFKIDDEVSWLEGKPFLDHFKNSAIWTASDSIKGWNLDSKKVIFSTQHMLGSKGACEVLGITCLMFAAMEVVALIVFLSVRKPS